MNLLASQARSFKHKIKNIMVFEMSQWNLKSNRKSTGALLTKHGKKTKAERNRDYLPTHIGAKKTKKIRTKGGGQKIVLKLADIANIIIDGKAQKAKIITVKENRADPHYVRRNIITKGAVIDTDLGKARVTSRPGQTGTINAILIKDYVEKAVKTKKA